MKNKNMKNKSTPNARCFVFACGTIIALRWMQDVQPWLNHNTLVAAIGYPVALVFVLLLAGRVLLDSISAGGNGYNTKEEHETRVMWMLFSSWTSLFFVVIVSFCEYALRSNTRLVFLLLTVIPLLPSSIMYWMWRDIRRDAYRRRIDWRDNS